MESRIGPYTFLAAERIIVCVDCRFGNVVDEAESHLATKPHNMPAEERRNIAARIRRLPGIFHSQEDLRAFQFPAAERAANPFLARPVPDGIGCRSCRYVCRSEKRMKAHCRQEHGWENPRPGGRASAKVLWQMEGSWQDVPWRVGVRCQRFFKKQAASGWFEVERAVVERGQEKEQQEQQQGEETTTDLGTPSWRDAVRRHETMLRAEMEEAQRMADGRTGVDFDSTWIRKLGCAKHLAGKDLLELWQASAEPMTQAARGKIRDKAVRAEQDRMSRLTESLDREVVQCRRRLELVPDEALAWLAGIEAEGQGDREFKASENAGTLRKYTSHWKSYLCYCVRACRLGRDEAEEARGVHFNDNQWDELCAIVELLNRVDGSGLTPQHGDDSLDDSGIGLEGDGRSEDETALDQHVFKFSIASIRQKVGFGIYRSPLVHSMAVSAWDGVSKMWIANVGTVTAKYAGLLWCSRLFMLEHIFGVELGIDQTADPEEELLYGAVEHFREQLKDWLVRGSFTPVSLMIKWMAYGKGHRRKEGGTPRLMWEADEKVMRYLGQPLKTVDFCRAAREGVAEAAELLGQLLYGNWAELEQEIDLKRIKDDLMKGPTGNSFMSEEENRWLQCGPRRVLELAGDRLWDKDRGCWRVGSVKRWLALLREFKMAHMANVHIWGGQPGRGPEITTMRYRDGDQLIRNVFVFDGQVFLITDRDKSKAIRDIGIKVARFLPQHVGKMMVAYIAWVAPLEELLLRDESLFVAVGRGTAGKAAVERSDAASQRRRTAQLLRDGWLWMDARPGFKGRWETAELSKRLVSLTCRFVGVELGVADYRHVSIEMGRKIIGLVVKQVEAEDGGNEFGDGHDDGGDEALTHVNKFDFVFVLQSTHGRRIAAQHYAVNVMFPNNLQPEKIASFREVSRLWHCFLEQEAARPAEDSNGGSVSSGSDSGKTKREAPKTDIGSRQKRQRLSVNHGGVEDDKLDGALREMLGDKACWKTDEQQDGMRRIMVMKDGDVLIVVLPTGGGKSIFFMLPSKLVSERGSVSIVVVPFVALIDDLVVRAQKFGVDCLRWQPADIQGREHPQRAPQLLVVSADLASTEEFIIHVDTLRARGKLRRIFVDECHTVIMDVGYRRRLEDLRGLHRYGCPVVLLTATLPVKLESWFRKLMIAEKADMIRALTVKKNICYWVKTVKPGRAAVDTEVAELASELGSFMGGDQKGVIYCRSRENSEALAEQVGCAHYHSEMNTAARQQVLAEWSECRSASRWIVATTGLGTGIDIEGITAVVHAGQPYGLVDFVQQTGRGGRRDVERVHSIIVVDGRKVTVKEGASNTEHENHDAMERFIRAEGCRRAPLGDFMDGNGRSCVEVGGDLCDRCQDEAGSDEGDEGDEGDRGDVGRRTSVRCDEGEGQQAIGGQEVGAGPVNAYGEDQRERQVRLDLLRQWLVRVGGWCGTCYIRWLRTSRNERKRILYKHRLEQCKTVSKEEYLEWRGRIRFAAGACCWKCGLPQTWCESAETGSDCIWKDQVLPLVMSTTKSEELRGFIKKEFGVDSYDGEGFTAWLGRSARLYGENMTNGLMVWEFLVCKFFDSSEREKADE